VRAFAAVQQDEEEGAVETVRKAVEQSGSVVEQDKGSVVPHRAPRCFLSRLTRFFHHARTIFTDHTIWFVPCRMVRANSARRRLAQGRRAGFAAPLAAIGATTLGVGLLVLSARLLQLRISLTDSSAKAGVYRLAESPAGRGALVAACLPPLIARQGLTRGYLAKGDCPAGAEPVAKVVGAVAGDTVEVESGWVAVNGIRFANSQTAAHDSAGRPLTHVPSGAYRVSADQVWLFGFNNRRSWDARYFGPVPAMNVRGVLRPVVTW
jgi:conjugative transfer signal peptidase TraF